MKNSCCARDYALKQAERCKSASKSGEYWMDIARRLLWDSSHSSSLEAVREHKEQVQKSKRRESRALLACLIWGALLGAAAAAAVGVLL